MINTANTRTRTAAIGLAVALTGSAALAQVGYVPPDAPRPRFGGEFALSEVGPVANYWSTECRTWRIRSQARRQGPKASPEDAAVMDRFLSGLISEKPDYQDLSPAMADAVRGHIEIYWPSFNRMGRYTVAKKVDTDTSGNAIYVVDQTGGRTHWNVAINPRGQIESAFMCGGQGL